jgi:membrane-associated phospholipid phosphatase
VGEIFEPLGLMGNTNVIYLGGIAAGWLTGLDPLLHVSRDLVVSHWLASGTYQLPRRWIGRYRPEQGRGPRAFGNGTALPSGHSSTIVQVAAVLSHHLDRRPASLLLWGMAGTVLFQRIDSEKHWASDVWLGAAWGYGVARLVLRNADRRRGEEGRVSPSGGARPDPGEVRIRPFRTAAGGVGVAFRIAVHGSGPG